MSEIKVIKPSFEILEPHMNPEQKVAKMARICYRSEAQASKEADANLINNCVQRTHFSVLEHGFVSVIFSNAAIPHEKFNGIAVFPDEAKVSSDAIWNNFNSDTRKKYIEVYGDDEIYKLIQGPGSKPNSYNVYAGNFHTWLSCIDEFMSVAYQKQFNLGFIFMLALSDKFYKEFPSVFKNLIEQVNEALKILDKKSDLYLLGGKEGTHTIEDYRKYFDTFEMIVTKACARMTLSAILRTDRAVTHELVRHRRGVAYSQESQRYVNYQNKGYEVVWPQMDPVKFDKASFKTPSGEANLLEGGYLQEDTLAFSTWRNAMVKAMNYYDEMRKSAIVLPAENEGADNPVITIPPEVARTVLPNSFATTIGVTWTPQMFINLMYRRLEKHAQWPIRYLLGSLVIEALRTRHPFFENFAPGLVSKWINDAFDMKIFSDESLKNDLLEYQKKRKDNINKIIAEGLKKIEENRKKAEQASKTDDQPKPTQESK